MNLFDEIVNEALTNQPHLSPLRIVVEKELLHHDILRILSQHDLLENLIFIGGTCLRCCYGGIRLSEDLDFTGGKDFSRKHLSKMGHVLENNLKEKYGLAVEVDEPIIDKKNVDTWKIKIVTRPEKKHFPSQRINIDICAVPSYEANSMMLINPYGIDMGTNGLIIQAQSREEIFADKLIAFAFRPNRMKYRDLWDIVWLHQQGIQPRFQLIPRKLDDRNQSMEEFLKLFTARKNALSTDQSLPHEFKQEMQRFLSNQQIVQVVEQAQFWSFLINLFDDLEKRLKQLEQG